MNQKQIISMASNFRTVPSSLINDSFNCTYQKFWRVIALAKLESIAGIILVSRATVWDAHSLHRTHEVHKALKMIIQVRLQRLIEGSTELYPFPSVDLETLLATLSDDVTYKEWIQWWHPLLPYATSPKVRSDLFGGTGTYLWRRNFGASWNRSSPQEGTRYTGYSG